MRRRIVLTLALLLLSAASSPPLRRYQDVCAVAGCCKERESYGASWHKSDLGTDFAKCKERNQSKDGDNVFDERGLVWWDVRCQ